MRARLVTASTFRIVAAVALTGAVCADPAFGQTPAAADPTAVASRVDAIFADFAKPASPGCSVGAYQDDRIVYQRAFGMANLDHDVALTPASVFHVASVSKQFTAAAIVLLAEDGKLSLDDDIRKYLPEMPDYGSPVTIRQMLHHTAGLRDYVTLLTFADIDYDDVSTPAQALAMLETGGAATDLVGAAELGASGSAPDHDGADRGGAAGQCRRHRRGAHHRPARRHR